MGGSQINGWVQIKGWVLNTSYLVHNVQNDRTSTDVQNIHFVHINCTLYTRHTIYGNVRWTLY